jgi:hypothetical protein
MKKLVFALVLFFVTVFITVGQNSSPADLILLLDTSSSMSASYRGVNDYLTGPFLGEFLRIGDTFHLIPFSDTSAVDISRRIEGRGDVETIIGRILLQYPLDPWSDIPGALDFVEEYAGTLPGSRPRKVILVTDGDVSPAPGSPSRRLDAAEFEGFVSDARTRFARKGIDLVYVKAPIAAVPSSGRPPAPPAARAPETPKPAERPPVAERPPSSTPAEQPPESRPPAAPPETVQAPSPAETGAADAPAPAESGTAAAPENTAPPPGSAAAPPPEPPRRESPPAEIREPAGGFSADGLPLPLIIGLSILGLLVLGLVVFLAARRLQGTPNRAMARAAAPVVPEKEPPKPPQGHNTDLLNRYAANRKPRSGPYENKYRPRETDYEGPLLLNLFVEDQNTAIGKRNIHSVKPGNSFTVGGGHSDFLIFLVPVPPHIGEIHCEGQNCTFIPRKPQYFPDTGSQSVPECIGKTIRIISDKKYEIRFRLERYEDPLKALNRLLHSVQVPG